MLQIPIGGGHVAKVDEPLRSQFDGNLSGAIQYIIAHGLFKILAVMGEGLGSFLGGAAVQFLEHVEPSLVEYTQPLIDILLKQKELPPELRQFFEQLKNPTHEGGAAILSGLATQAGGAVAGTVLGALLKPLTNVLNANIRGSIPPIGDALAMDWRQSVGRSAVQKYYQMTGYPDEIISGYDKILRPRAGIGDMFSALYRGVSDDGHVKAEMTLRGYTDEDIARFTELSRPLLDINIILPALYRQNITTADAIDLFAKSGYTPDQINIILSSVAPIPNQADLIRFGVREAYRDDIAAKWGYDEDFPQGFADDMKKLGYDEIWSKRYWRAHWELPSVQLGMEMTHRGILSTEEFGELLRISDYPAEWRKRMQDVIYTPYTRVDVRRMYGLKILDYDQVIKSYKDIGYDDEHAKNLADFTVMYEDENGDSTKEKTKSLTQSIVSSAVKKGIMSQTEAITELINIGYSSEDAATIIRLALWQQAVDDKPETKSEFQRDMRAIIERGYLNGIVDRATAETELGELQYTSDEIAFILNAIDYNRTERESEDYITLIRDAYLNGAIEKNQAIGYLGKMNVPATQQTLLLDKWDAVLSLPTRRLTEAQYRAAYKAKIIEQPDYQQALVDLGYIDKDIEIMLKLYTRSEESETE
jgi:hypothetical protein